MNRSLLSAGVVLCFALTAACFPATSRLGESCSRSGDCITGKCVNLECSASYGCASDGECLGDPLGGKCKLICGCTADVDCSNTANSSGMPVPYCGNNDGGFASCSALRP